MPATGVSARVELVRLRFEAPADRHLAALELELRCLRMAWRHACALDERDYRALAVRRMAYGSPLEIVVAAGATAAPLVAVLYALRDWSATRRKSRAEAAHAEATSALAWLEFYDEVRRVATSYDVTPEQVEDYLAWAQRNRKRANRPIGRRAVPVALRAHTVGGLEQMGDLGRRLLDAEVLSEEDESRRRAVGGDA